MSRQVWLAAAQRAVSERVLAWRGERGVVESLGAWVDLQFDRTENADFAETFAKACPWPGAQPADYLQRVVPLAGGDALAGIRFLGGMPEFRFVDLLAHTGPDEPAVLGRAGLAALEAFAPFAPSALRVRQASERMLEPAGWRVEVDQHVLAGRLDELATRPRAAAGLRLESVEPEEAEAFTARAHAAWAERDPELAAKVSLSGADELSGCVEDGVLAYIVEGEERVGLIGVTRGQDAELDGYFVEEEVIALPFRGRGLGAAAQALTIEALAPQSPEALLFGTIDAANSASLRTAERVGRVRIGAYRFLFPPG